MHSVVITGVSPLTRATARVVAILVVVVALACRGPASPAAQGGEPPAMGAATTDGTGADERAPALSWMSPQDGATVTSPVHVMFHATDFEIAAVPDGVVELARPGAGHYHIGVDAECLPVGVDIPKADPWVHFGDGGSMMNMQLTPGEHSLTLQVGDDLHRPVEGLCRTIRVLVTG